MGFRKHHNSLLEDAVQETQYREKTYNHELYYVRNAIGNRSARTLTVCVLVALLIVGVLVWIRWNAAP